MKMTLLSLWLASAASAAFVPARQLPDFEVSVIEKGELVSSCCHRLDAKLGSNIVNFPGSSTYTTEQAGLPIAGYWSAQEAELTPACRVTPTCSDEVRLAVAELVRGECQFAVRGGGHMPWAGSANIGDSGVTIDLSAMNQVKVSEDRTVTSVGGGARWGDVYLPLDEMGLAVSGGRVAEVGVGGLITGGGMSFFSHQYGFVCDNVINFELVTGRGKILQVNDDTFPDLFKALKGGSNNFGIVTRFDLKTIEQGKLWGGSVLSHNTPELQAQQFQAFEDFTTASGAGDDPYSAIINAYATTSNGSFIVNTLTNSRAEAYPAILSNFTSLQPQIQNTLRTSNLTDFTVELNTFSPHGLRQLFGTITVGNNATLFAALKNISDTVYAPLFAANTSGLQVSFVLEPVPTSITDKHPGESSLGLDPSDGNLVWLLLTVAWTNPTDDEAVTEASKSIVEQATELAQSWGLYNEYIYLNYALPSQDPIASYGSDDQAAMQEVSRKYDPEQVFQKLVPGGFKLYR